MNIPNVRTSKLQTPYDHKKHTDLNQQIKEIGDFGYNDVQTFKYKRESTSYPEYQTSIFHNLLKNNHHNDLNHIKSNLDQLFMIADQSKDYGNYEVTNNIRAIIFEYAIATQDPSIKYIYEDASQYSSLPSGVINDKEITSDYYYDLAVLIYQEQNLNIPLPLLTAEAVNLFITKAHPINKLNHNRSIKESDDNNQSWGEVSIEEQIYPTHGILRETNY